MMRSRPLPLGTMKGTRVLRKRKRKTRPDPLAAKKEVRLPLLVIQKRRVRAKMMR